jgi:crotonobetainyl-CoA:carnitine CoA-transferase CaiB-like acyl-CoA transferase
MPPLDGILVADFSRVLAGPYATMLLGDLGADVVKVERPGTGDDTRAWGPPWRDDDSTYYLGLNRNKRSVVLDLTDEEDRELARRLALRADVMVESFRPGLMEQWGLDGDTLRETSPALISCSVTAFGSGDGRTLPGYDFLLQAMGGLMHVTGEEGGRPLKVGAPIVDLTCGLLATIGIQAALAEREHTGRGQHVELSLMDSALTALVNQASAWVAGGVAPIRRGNRHPSITPYETFDTADKPIAVAVANDRLFQRLCGVLGLEELAGDERFATSPARIQHADELAELLGAALARESADHWIERLRAASVPAGPINGVDDAFAFAEELGMEPTEGHVVRPPMRFDGERPPIRRPPPGLDEHGDEIRTWLRGPGGSSSAA